jgi:hypothetical protein
MKKIITSLGILIISITAANAQLFIFSSVADSGNSNEATGVSVSGSVLVDVIGGTVKFTLNNDNTGSIGDLTEFGFWNTADGSNELDWITPISHTTGKNWTGPVDRVTDLWGNGDLYEGAVADNRGSGGDGIAKGDSAMFTFTADGFQDLTGLISVWTANTNNTKGSNSDLRVRFQSTPNGGSDKLYIDLKAVPEPSTYGIIGASALVLLIAARHFKRK